MESTVDIFNGQPNQGLLEYKMDQGKVYVIDNGKRIEQKGIGFSGHDTGYKNGEIVLSEDELLKNIHQIQTQNNIHLSNEVIKRLGACQLDIEMETGTGKTYVYVKTMFELNKRYGWTKFIVVVPSIAIREGVKKSFDITQDHFMELYGKKARYFVYNSDNLNQIDTYSQSADISVMIINTQAFNTSMKEGAKNKYARIIYDKRDEFGSRRPIDVIAANRPIIILDEPQKMGGAATQTALERFNPLFTLNYSATHRETHNPVYVLDALDAYNQKLVKKIEVVGFELRNLKGTESYIYFDSVVLSKNEPPMVRMEIDVQSKSGNIKRAYKNVGEGDDLFYLSGEMEQYRGYMLTEIDPLRGKAIFSNGVTLNVKDIQGNVTADHKARIQIRETIKAHFRKESALFKRGIKCLSLFFVDEVANYRQYDDDGNQKLGRYGEIFEQEYMDELNNNQNMYDPDYMAYLGSISAHATHAGYFSIDKKGRSINSSVKRGSDQSDDTSAYDLILKNKERLLSLDEPVRFIFSHSALREGWDNPNVFQICSLRQSNSVSQKRQEVGRGLRLCVDRYGVRQDNDALPEEVHKVNRLTVIASEGYATFVADLQRDIKQDLYDRPTKADVDFFTGKIVTCDDGTKYTITKNDAQDIYFQLRTKNYITKQGEVTEIFRKACADEKLEPLADELQPMSNSVMRLVQSIYDASVLKDMIDDGSKTTTPDNKLNDNFMKKEFQELWRRINHKYAYTVSFNSEELIEKAVAAINKELEVTQLSYVVTRGEQKDKTSLDDMKHGEMMRQQESATEKLKTDIVSNVRYDLLGKISSATRLTRKTVAAILSKIRPPKFDMYKANPEEFIRKVTRLILEQKATIIVEHISYNRIDGQFDSDIFTQEKHGTIDRAFEGKKSIVDYVFTDSEGERKFVGQIDTAKEVAVYAKLPKGFHIPTPVGNYSPDWAIAFQEGEVKHIYFVAETKGSMSSMDLREIEKGKIACAEKLFDQISTSNVKYGKVDSFETLMDIVK
ncbi:MAG: DEAD/DEAH box helicase family protein [Hallella sp.]|uniref:type III restriction-modification system endonuclease n=1 Tax=Hallella sp. TaxID=2980186 RepID=UPI00259082D9|nr:DEAD/DEAH box helicase family protein [Hallella sp.]MDD7144817.1 DEAD/DEAH box helicase family protein [Hallella sp.]